MRPHVGAASRTRRNADGATTGSGRSIRARCARSPLVLEPEQVPHRVSVDHAVGADGGLLHAHRRQVEQLVQDLRRHRLERPRARRRCSLAFASSARADLLGARAQRRDRRHDVERRAPRAEPLRLLGDELLGALRLGAPPGERLGDDGLEVVDVVEEAAVELGDRGIEVARNGDVDEEERPARRVGARRPARRTTAGRARRRDDDVDLAELARRRSSSASGRAAEALRELARASSGVRFATNAISAPREARFAPRARRSCRRRSAARAGPSRSPKTCAASAAAADETDAGLSPIAVSRAHALADGERLAEHAVEQRPRRAGLVRGAHLAEDLALAGHERVEPGGDAEEVQRRRLLVQAVERAVERLAARAARSAASARAPRRRRRRTARCGCRSRGRRASPSEPRASAAASAASSVTRSRSSTGATWCERPTSDERHAKWLPASASRATIDEREAAEREVRGARRRAVACADEERRRRRAR